MSGRVVLVTGVSRHLGSRLAAILSRDPGVERVVGVDIVPPREDIGGADFVRADIRNPIIGKVIAAAGVDTVVHMGVLSTPVQAGGRVTMKEINVIGTMQLLAACQKAESIQRLIVKSTSSVYGAGPKDPAMFTEDTEPRSQPRSGWAKDSVEVESYVRGFARRRPICRGIHRIHRGGWCGGLFHGQTLCHRGRRHGGHGPSHHGLPTDAATTAETTCRISDRAHCLGFGDFLDDSCPENTQVFHARLISRGNVT